MLTVGALAGFGGRKAGAVTATIDTNQVNFNLRSWLIANGLYDGVSVFNATVTIAAGVVISASAPGFYAFDTGSFPATSALTLVNNGHIRGCGGAGGTGATQTLAFPTAGGSGGTALNLGVNTTIDNTNGTIFGGGGGGGGGGSMIFDDGAGGGGGDAGGGEGGGGDGGGGDGGA